MPMGLQCRDASGNIIFDLTDRFTRLIGSFSLDGSSGSGTVTAADLVEGDFFALIDVQTSDFFKFPPQISVSGTTITWGYGALGAGSRAPCTVYYGVF